MLKHYFSQKAEKLSSQDLSTILEKRLHDMGYQYNSISSSNLNIGAGTKSGSPYKTLFDYQGDVGPDAVRKTALLIRSGDYLAETQPSSIIKFAVWPREGDTRVVEEITVSDLLARPHPHPFRSLVRRALNNMGSLFAQPYTPTISS